MESIIFGVLALQGATLLLLFGPGFRPLCARALKLFLLADGVAVGSFFLFEATAPRWMPVRGAVSLDLAELGAVFAAVLVAIWGSAALLARAAWGMRGAVRHAKRSSFLITIGGTLGFYGVLVLTGIYRAVTLPDVRALSAESLVREFAADGPTTRRMQALLVLRERSPEETVPAILKQLDHIPTHSEAIGPLLRLLGEGRNEEAIPTLRIWLQKELSPVAWSQGAWSLAQLGYREVAAEVDARLRSNDAGWLEVTPQLLEILGFLGAADSVPTIAMQLENAATLKGEIAASIMQSGIISLIGINTPESRAALATYSERDPSRKQTVDSILAQLGAPPA